MAKRAASRQTPSVGAGPHRHGKGQCLNILRQLSAFIDDDLAEDICREIRQHVGACPNCEEFVASLRQTVTLCRHYPAPALSSDERARMRVMILKAARESAQRPRRM
jgi:anti-sigma factor RsiW